MNDLLKYNQNGFSLRLDVTLNEVEEIFVDVVIQGSSSQNK